MSSQHTLGVGSGAKGSGAGWVRCWGVLGRAGPGREVQSKAKAEERRGEEGREERRGGRRGGVRA